MTIRYGSLQAFERKSNPARPQECSINQEATPGGIIRISAKSRLTSVAGAMAGTIRKGGRTEVQAIGPGTLNQATKAFVIARKYLVRDGLDIICIPSLTVIDIEGKGRTAVRLIVEP
jgi:stage V sporulation protein S